MNNHDYDYENDDNEPVEFGNHDDLLESVDDLANEDYNKSDFDNDDNQIKSTSKINSIDNLDDDEIINTGSIDNFQTERVSDVTGKKVVNYVDNDAFCNAIVSWNKKCKEAEEKGIAKPPMPDTIGQAIINIAEGLSNRYNFRNYTYVDEMAEDAIYMAVRAVKNFDPSKSTNGFGYFTFIMWRAMTGRIKAEHKENDLKLELLKDPMYLGYTAQSVNGDDNVDKDRMLKAYEN